MQGVFEPVLEALLREQPQWARHGATGDPGLLLQIAATAGLDAEAARTQMLSPSTVGILNRDRADVKTAGVRGTPTFFVNGRRLDPFGEAELRALVAEEVAASGSRSEEHTSELQSLMRTSYAVFCLTKTKQTQA